MAGKLFIVATPIGNLGDLSERAKATLASVHAVLCEDTRVTGKLMSVMEIKKPLIAYHQHSKIGRVNEILDMLREGKDLALVTDAGTPGISDPGGMLIEKVVEELPEVEISPIPGPSALIAALSVSGFPADKFVFQGFPPQKKGRKGYFETLAAQEGTVAFYESTHRILKTLDEMNHIMAERTLVVCRELTKLHETIYRGTAAEVTDALNSTSIKGEFVIVVGPR